MPFDVSVVAPVPPDPTPRVDELSTPKALLWTTPAPRPENVIVPELVMPVAPEIAPALVIPPELLLRPPVIEAPPFSEASPVNVDVPVTPNVPPIVALLVTPSVPIVAVPDIAALLFTVRAVPVAENVVAPVKALADVPVWV